MFAGCPIGGSPRYMSMSNCPDNKKQTPPFWKPIYLCDYYRIIAAR
jgi:hypothetical protein